MTAVIVLVLGGTRSGKSAEAEAIVSRLADGRPVTYLATANPDGDPALDHRIATHRSRRPDHWRTVEVADDLPARLREESGPVLLDALGPWVAARLDADVDALVEALVDALQGRRSPTVVVSEEVGLAVHPPTEIGRRFVDVLGNLNRRIADVADEVRLVIAGRVLDLPRSPERP